VLGWVAELVRHIGLVGYDDPGDRNERQAYVADRPEQAVQRGLVDDDAVEGGGAVAVGGEGRPSNQLAQRLSRCPLKRIS